MPRRRALHTVVAEGELLPTLEALRDKVATQIDKAEHPRDVATLSARLLTVLGQIAALKGQKLVPLATETAEPSERTTLDELAQRRADRGADAARPDRPAGSRS